ncbi:LOW QUALITY PROTEIN: hypothetical protein CVT25_015086 [Psilocybe cyanescens]|uniref:THH1/TOM1/TOM3 domain-containing protein n=1 Tax=Psilocybe cyanescens TaxID=93625 RepID=A0A409WS33_PSICY|nr:LOW QUALITY PROTEIN: hypothetical protein CVT25_015086 [Psilocybe cyanescens]
MSILSPADEEREISSNLNSSMLFNFLMVFIFADTTIHHHEFTHLHNGIRWDDVYSTMSHTVSKKSANMNRRIILSAISILYLICFSNFITQWYILDLSVVINGDTRQSIFIATEFGPVWIFVLTVFLLYSLLIVSDGLLVPSFIAPFSSAVKQVWICFNIWGQSFRIILVPLTLVVVEFGLFVAVIALSVLISQASSDAKATLVNSISSALAFVSSGTTVITSLLIGYKIHSTYRFHDRHFKRLFNHVVIVFIESSAAYSLVLVINATSTVIPSATLFGSPLAQMQYYVDVVLIIVAGMAPTVMVARLGLANPDDFRSQRGSGVSVNATGEVNASTQIGQWAPNPSS